MGNIGLPYAHLSTELRIFLFSCVLLLPQFLSAQILKTAWDHDYGGNLWEDCNSAVETSDGGYLLGGYTSSTVTPAGDVSDPSLDGFFPPPDVGDYWIAKTDDAGILEWDRRYGGNKQDRLWAAQETPDGGYIIGGTSNSDAGPQKSDASRGDEDYWIIRTDASGTILWDKSYGADSIDYFYSLLQTSDGGFLLGGISRSDMGFEKTENHKGDFDMWIIKTDAMGNILWDQTIGGNGEERLNEMQETADGHYVLAGSTASDRDNLDVERDALGGKDYWLVKIDSMGGNKIWEYRYGGIEEDEIQSFTQTQDGGFLLGGGSRSPVTPMMKGKASQWVDFWIIKIDDLGVIEWERTFGGPQLDNCYSVKQNNIGNYLLGGYSASGVGPDKTEPNRGAIGTEDFWLLYLAPDGTKLWDKTLGGSSRDVLENLFQTQDGGYLLAGHSSSGISGDKTSDNNGLNDFWIIKTLCNVSVDFRDTTICPNTEVMINATDTNCVQCTWAWDDGSIDSIRHTSLDQNTTYSVTLVDGVGCSWTDDIEISMYTPPVLDLGPDQEVCEGDSILIGTSLTGLSYDWSTGEMTSNIFVDTVGKYQLIVTDANTCTAIDSLHLMVNPLPEVMLGNDTSICIGEMLLLNAANPGAAYNWFPGGNSQTINPIPSQATIYAVTVTDGNNCTGIDSLSVLEVFSLPENGIITAECNELNTFYTVTFDIIGGDLNTIVVTGDLGTITAGTFTSAPIPRAQAYTFFINDNNDCGPVEVSGSFDCACETDAGLLAKVPALACGTESVAIPHSGELLDQNDVLQFILHDGDALTMGNVLLTQNTSVFQYQAPLVYGQTYYVVAVAGNEASGSVNLLDGCLSVSNGIPIVFYEKPVAVIVADLGLRITCSNPNLPLSATSSQPFGALDFAWSTIGMGNITTATTLPAIEINEAGIYQVIVTDQHSGCTALETVEVEADEGVPNILVGEPGLYTCQDTLIALDASGSSFGPPFTIIWSGGNIDGYNGLDPVVNAPGNYSLEIINGDNGCRVEEQVVVPADTIAPMVDAGTFAFLDCQSFLAVLNGSYENNCTTCLFSWSTRDGNFIGGLTTLNPTVDVAGTYEMNVLNTANGCTNVDEVLVLDDPDLPVPANLQSNGPPCAGDEEGRIIVGSVNGGLPPYLYSLDGTNFSSRNEFFELPPGNYQLFLQDAKGCEWDSTFSLPAAQPLVVELGNDQIIDLGEEINLYALVNRPVDSVFWISKEEVECGDCLEQTVSPVNETSYTVIVQDAAGCEVSDLVNIRVRKDRNVFIPSAFSSDFNGTNDYFTIFADQSVKHIKSLRVFSRWGEVVFERLDFAPNIETQGWDGTMRGQDLDPGIYVYAVVIEFIDGHEELYKGDVLLTK